MEVRVSMRKVFSILVTIIVIFLNPFIVLSEDSAQKIPTLSEHDYSFQKDYDAIEIATNSIFYVDIYDANMEYIGSASGFVIFREHLFVTNYHVIENAFFIKIWDEMDNSYILDRIVAVDKSSDLAILVFPDGEKYKSLEYQLDAELKRGQPVTTIGSPQGIQNTVAFGNISAFPNVEGNKVIQFTAPISHGSSGGVLFDDYGKVIGITTAVLSEGENIGFAVPIDNLIELYKQWDKKNNVAFCSPTPRPPKMTTPKPTNSPIPTSSPNNKTNYGGNSLEDFKKELYERIIKETNISAFLGLYAQWNEEANDYLRIHFQIENIDSKRTIEAVELYVYATDIWDNQIYGNNNVYKWTTIKNIIPGTTIYSDYISIPNRKEIITVFCGIHKVKYSDGTIQIANKIEYESWRVKK